MHIALRSTVPACDMLSFLTSPWPLLTNPTKATRLPWRTLSTKTRPSFRLQNDPKRASIHAVLTPRETGLENKRQRSDREGGRRLPGQNQRKKRDSRRNAEDVQPTFDIKKVEQLRFAGLGVVVLKPEKNRLFQNGRPTALYSGGVSLELAPVHGNLHTGSCVAVVDGTGRTVAHGVYNATSMFRVRLLSWSDENAKVDQHELSANWTIDEALSERLKEAVALRRISGLPSDHSTAYRVVNGDGDRLPGLFVDVFGKSVVISCAAAWCVVHRRSILQAVRDIVVPPDTLDWQVIWRVNEDRLKQDGVDLDEVSHELPDDAQLSSDETHPNANTVVMAKENNILFQLDTEALVSGQKTGHYADQRESRAYVRALLSARSHEPTTVLDLFCYTGGFTLYSVAGLPHVHATAVDSSPRALDGLKLNAELNDVSGQITAVQSDVERFANEHVKNGSAYDVVIVDPPKYAPTVKTLQRAWGKYKRVNAAAIRLVSSPGLLVTCSCSAAVASRRAEFVRVVADAAKDAERHVTLIKTMGAACDHPVLADMPETEYLTVCVFAVR